MPNNVGLASISRNLVAVAAAATIAAVAYHHLMRNSGFPFVSKS